jgi:hypothetical protein
LCNFEKNIEKVVEFLNMSFAAKSAFPDVIRRAVHKLEGMAETLSDWRRLFPP